MGEGGLGSVKRNVKTRSRAKELRTNLTEPERRLWNILRGNRLGVKFQRQVVIIPYIADFAARSRRLVIELDGDTHATTQPYDNARTEHLQRLGYRVLRFTNSDVMTSEEGVIRSIMLALGTDIEAPLSPTSATASWSVRGTDQRLHSP